MDYGHTRKFISVRVRSLILISFQVRRVRCWNIPQPDLTRSLRSSRCAAHGHGTATIQPRAVMASRTTVVVRPPTRGVGNLALLTFLLGLVPALARIIQVHFPVKVGVPQKSMCLKPRGTRQVAAAESSHNLPSLLHSRMTISTIPPPPTGTRSITLKSPSQTITRVQLCASLCLPFLDTLADNLEHSQQSVSSLTNVPDDMFEGSGQVFTKFGFEYWAEPLAPEKGFITWMVDGKPSHRMGADAMGPDQGPGGSGVGRRLIPEEPMVGFNASPPIHACLTGLSVTGP